MRYWNETDNQTADSPVNNSYLAAENPRLQRQFSAPLELGDRPLVVGRRPAAGEGLPPWQPDLELDDAAPFWLSRNHFTIEKGEGGYRVRDLSSTLGTIVNGEPIGQYLRADGSTASGYLASEAPLRAGENEVIAGGPDSPFVFSVFITSRSGNDIAGRPQMTAFKANTLEGNRQSYWNDAEKNWGNYDSGIGFGAGIGIGRTIAALPAARVAVARLFVVLALSVLLGGCGLTMGQDVRAYNTCLTRHPDDTMVCEGPRQAYELDPSVVQPRSVASRPVAGHGY
jgi:hypothetical protein